MGRTGHHLGHHGSEDGSTTIAALACARLADVGGAVLAQKNSDITYRAFRLADGLPSWYEDHEVERYGTVHSTWVRKDGDGWLIQTLEGTERAKDGDWCMEGISGEYYPISGEGFHDRYESAGDDRWRQVPKPVECWIIDTLDLSLMPAWVRDAVARGLIEVQDAEFIVHASWGDQLATLGHDVLIHASNEDIYPCKLEIFEASYTIV